jgi:hypothetical protein
MFDPDAKDLLRFVRPCGSDAKRRPTDMGNGLSTYATDHRYYEIIHKAFDGQFQHRYLVLKDVMG